MALTAEKQRRFGVNTPRGGYNREYTRFRGVYDPAEGIDERPKDANPGDVFDAENDGKCYKYSVVDGKGVWTYDPNEKSQSGGGSGGGSSLPSMTGKNGKVLGVTLDSEDKEQAEWVTPSGGGAEKFVVTLTEDDGIYTADKSVADVMAAYNAGKICFARYNYLNAAQFDLLLIACEEEGLLFTGIFQSDNPILFNVIAHEEGGGVDPRVDEWNVQITQVEQVEDNSQFIVTLTLENDGEHDIWVANKTCAQIYAAHQAGKECVAKLTYEYEGFDIPVEAPLSIAIRVEDGGETAYACTFSVPFMLAESMVSLLNIVGIGDNKEEWNVKLAVAENPIPEYDSSQNGKVLGVSSGDLAWVDNYAPLIVTMTEDQQNPGTYVGDKTIGEIKTAFEAGRNVVGIVPALNASVSVIQVAVDNSGIEISTGNKDVTFEGTANDYPSITP